MKVAFCLESKFLFNRFVRELSSNSNIELEEKNLQTLHLVRNAIEFWEIKLFIIDPKLAEIRKEIENQSNDIQFILYNSFDETLEAILDRVVSYKRKTIELDFRVQSETDMNPSLHKSLANDNEQIKTVEKIIEKEVTKYRDLERKVILVSSLWDGAGSTTFAINLARAIAERGVSVAYIEHPLASPYMFDYLSIPMKERQKEYSDYVRSDHLKEPWHEKGIDWYVIDTRQPLIHQFPHEELMKLLYKIKTTIVLIDVSATLNNKEIQKLAHDVDYNIVCIEPDVVKLDRMSEIDSSEQRKEKQSIDFLEKLTEKNPNYMYVNSKGAGIEDQTINEMLGKPIGAKLPLIDYRILMQCVWNSTFPYDQRQLKMSLEKGFKPIIADILPKELQILRHGEKKFIKNKFFNRKGEAK